MKSHRRGWYVVTLRGGDVFRCFTDGVAQRYAQAQTAAGRQIASVKFEARRL